MSSKTMRKPRRLWTDADEAFLARHYPDVLTKTLCTTLSRTKRQIYAKASVMGLKKSEAFMASLASGRIQLGMRNPGMVRSQFKPGQTPWSKGTVGRVGVQDGCRATQFKPGRLPSEARNYMPLGSVRVTKDGYLERKVSDDQSIVPARRWTAIHRLVWEEAHGAIPDGHVVVFKPGRLTVEVNLITADALECLTRQELMKRNSVHAKYPPELARLVILRGAINRQINKRAKAHEQDHQ